MTARDRLARAIGLLHELTQADVEDIVDQGLANPGDFEATDDPTTYRYAGDRWQVQFSHGRPHLVEAVDVPEDAPASAVAEDECRFGLVVDMLEQMRGGTVGDDLVAELREGWSGVFAEDERRDREEPGRGSAGSEWARRQAVRADRAVTIIGCCILPVDEAWWDDDDRPSVGRYLVLATCPTGTPEPRCQVAYADDVDGVLALVAEVLATARQILAIHDLDADGHMTEVAVRLRLSLTDGPDTVHERTLPRW